MKAGVSTGRESRVRRDSVKSYVRLPKKLPRVALFNMDVSKVLARLPKRPIFDLVITSPPYNLGKSYESKTDTRFYLDWQRKLIDEIVPRVKSTGSICWQVGNYVDNGQIEPLDISLHPIFVQNGLQLRNRIIWHFGHGLHCQRRFSGRYETVLWYTKSDEYNFDLDAVRVQSKYPGKRSYKGPNAGKLSSNPKGKNPEDVWRVCDDVWSIPNVKGGHKEKTIHPCQFPVGLAERLILALTKKRDLVFDPFCGVGSSGVAAVNHGRDFWGAEILSDYTAIAKTRLDAALGGQAIYRPHDQPIYDHTKSSLSIRPLR